MVQLELRHIHILIWHKELWLIDHGASFYFHHSWTNWEKTALTPFPLIKDHALISKATKLQEAHDLFTSKLNNTVLREIVSKIPDAFLNWEEGPSNEEIREVYYQFLSTRLAQADIFLKAAQDAR